jgi:hypothetical protein
VYLLRDFIEVFKLLLNQFLIFLVFQALISRKSIITIQIGITDLIDNILADNVDRVSNLIFDEVKVAVNRLLQKTALGFYAAVHRIFLY